MKQRYNVILDTDIGNSWDDQFALAYLLKLELFNIVDSHIYYQRICIRIMYNNQWIDMKKYKYSNELLSEIGKILGGLIKSLGVNKNAQNS